VNASPSLPRRLATEERLAIRRLRAGRGPRSNRSDRREREGTHGLWYPLSRFQNTKFELTAAGAELTAGQAMVDQALLANVAGDLRPVDAAKLKLFCPELQGQNRRPLPAAVRRLRLRARIPDCPPLRRRPGHSYLRWHQRGDEVDHRQVTGAVDQRASASRRFWHGMGQASHRAARCRTCRVLIQEERQVKDGDRVTGTHSVQASCGARTGIPASAAALASRSS